MIMASVRIMSAWARTTGRAIEGQHKRKSHKRIKEGGGEDVPMPMTTKKPVKNRPTSRTAAPELSTKSSGLAQRLQIQLGIGATT